MRKKVQGIFDISFGIIRRLSLLKLNFKILELNWNLYNIC